MKAKRIILMSAIAACAIVNQASAHTFLEQAKSYVSELLQGSTQKEKVADLFVQPALMPERLYDTFLALQSTDEEAKKAAISTVEKDMKHLQEQIALVGLDKTTQKKISFYFAKMNFGIVPRFNVYYMPNLFETVMNAVQYKLPRERYALIFLRNIGDLANKMDEAVDPKNKEQMTLRKFIVQSLKEFDTAMHPFVHTAKIPKATALTKKQLVKLINDMWEQIKKTQAE